MIPLLPNNQRRHPTWRSLRKPNISSMSRLSMKAGLLALGIGRTVVFRDFPARW